MKLFLFLSEKQLKEFSSNLELTPEQNYRKHQIILQKLEDYFTIRPINQDNNHLIDEILTFFTQIEDYSTCIKIRELVSKNKEIFSNCFTKTF